MNSAAPDSIETFIARLPKVELHIHLEGSLRPETLRELAQAKGRLHDETEEWIQKRLATNYHYESPQEFLEAFKLVTLLLESPEDYALATMRLCEWLASQKVKYAEITLSAGVILWKRQPVDAIFQAIVEASREAEARQDIRTRWIFDAIRHFGVAHAREVLTWALRFRDQGVVAFGIGGDESRGPAEVFAKVYHEARDAGLHVTAHAGESAGPESVRASVELLRAERIGHGLAAARDPELIALLRERQIPLEVCPTSNVCTRLVPRFEDHPLPQFLKAGLLVTLNSDDPGLFGTNLEREFVLAAKAFGLTRAQITQLSENAIRASFLSEDEKVSLMKYLRLVAGTV